MFALCTDVVGHAASKGVCTGCGRIICGTCNPGPQCAGGCDPVPPPTRGNTEVTDLEFRTEERRVSKKRVKTRNEISLFEEEETGLFDTIRLKPPGTPYYAYVREVEEEEVVGKPNLFHFEFETFSTAWFDALATDLSDLPPWDALPLAAEPAIMSLTVDYWGRQVLSGGTVTLDEHKWVRMWVERIAHGYSPQGTPARCYLAPAGFTANALAIPRSGRMTDAFEVLRVERVRPTSDGTRKLNRLWGAIRAQDL